MDGEVAFSYFFSSWLNLILKNNWRPNSTSKRHEYSFMAALDLRSQRDDLPIWPADVDSGSPTNTPTSPRSNHFSQSLSQSSEYELIAKEAVVTKYFTKKRGRAEEEPEILSRRYDKVVVEGYKSSPSDHDISPETLL